MSIENTVYNSVGLYLGNLRDRWQDEKEYEDWNDYVTALKKKVDEIDGAEFISMKKRPFSFQWKTADGVVREMRATSRQITMVVFA